MNVGQILEMMTGWAAHVLDTQMINPIFDSASEADIHKKVPRPRGICAIREFPRNIFPPMIAHHAL